MGTPAVAAKPGGAPKSVGEEMTDFGVALELLAAKAELRRPQTADPVMQNELRFFVTELGKLAQRYRELVKRFRAAEAAKIAPAKSA